MAVKKAKAAVQRPGGVQPEAKAPKAWAAEGAGYAFRPADGVTAALTPSAGQWAMLVTAGGKRYAGTRPTLEDAFKATDRLLYQHAREEWLGSDCKAVIAPWAGDLSMET